MPQIRYDGKSLIIDDRRIWIVSAGLHYSRIPHELWRDRIRAAKQAGCNTIETYVFWNFHEPSPKQFNFAGDHDLRRFVEIIGEEGLYCILRPGPYVCSEWDAGGHPAWLWQHESNADPMKFREFNGPYLQACSRYLAAVMEQVADLQMSRETDKPGPIIMMQVENEWFCRNEKTAQLYFEALMRDLRGNGCTTPIIACNNLWYRVDGAIDTWNASGRLPATLRQFPTIQPRAPRFVTEYWSGWFDHWDGEHAQNVSPQLNLFRLAGILATGGQFNFYMFHGGTNFGFYGGRTVGPTPKFMTTSYDYDAPLSETGGRTGKYDLSKRICTFASQFGHVFANLEPTSQPTVIRPKDRNDHPPSVIHQTGDQGDVVFILKSENDKTDVLDLLLPNGMTVPVSTGKDRAAWLLLETNLSGVATLDLTNLRPFAWIDQRMLVLFGPADSDGVVSIDGTIYQFKVPKGKTPHVETHENITLVAMNTDTVDAAYITDKQLIIGCAGLDANDQPMPRQGYSQITTLNSDGSIKQSRAPKVAAKPTAPRAGKWSYAPCVELDSPDDAGFEALTQPTSHEKLGHNFGYGWYRLTAMPPTGKLNKLIVPMPGCGDRLHFFQNNKLVATHGLGPGFTQDPFKLEGKTDLTVLADNLGRFNYGAHLIDDTKGLADHLYAIKPAKVNKPRFDRQKFPDLNPLQAYTSNHNYDHPLTTSAATWNIRLTLKTPMVIELPPIGCLAAICANGEIFKLHDADGSRGLVRFVLSARDKIWESGQNELSIHLKNQDLDPAKVLKDVKFYQVEAVTDGRTNWHFKPYSVPADQAFRDAPQRTPALPAFYRTTFNVKHTDTPLCVEPHGMSKGQIYLNGHNVGRYFMQTATGKTVPPQTKYYLPEPWLKTDEPNVLTLFDEHGKTPDKVKFTYVDEGPYA